MIKFNNIFFIALILTIIACKELTSNQENINVDDRVFKMDTSNQFIYDFMKVVIKDQNLNYGNGLTPTPESSIDINGDDKSFLTELLIKEEDLDARPKITLDSLDSILSSEDSNKIDINSYRIVPSEINLFSSSSLFEECLTQQDINYIFSEKKRLKDFKWDNQRLGFNLTNDNNWYSFSLPYFSKDKKIAIILVRDLCKPFLCGGGYTLVFKYKEGKWTSKKTNSWIH